MAVCIDSFDDEVLSLILRRTRIACRVCRRWRDVWRSSGWLEEAVRSSGMSPEQCATREFDRQLGGWADRCAMLARLGGWGPQMPAGSAGQTGPKSFPEWARDKVEKSLYQLDSTRRAFYTDNPKKRKKVLRAVMELLRVAGGACFGATALNLAAERFDGWGVADIFAGVVRSQAERTREVQETARSTLRANHVDLAKRIAGQLSYSGDIEPFTAILRYDDLDRAVAEADAATVAVHLMPRDLEDVGYVVCGMFTLKRPESGLKLSLVNRLLFCSPGRQSPSDVLDPALGVPHHRLVECMIQSLDRIREHPDGQRYAGLRTRCLECMMRAVVEGGAPPTARTFLKLLDAGAVLEAKDMPVAIMTDDGALARKMAAAGQGVHGMMCVAAKWGCVNVIRELWRGAEVHPTRAAIYAALPNACVRASVLAALEEPMIAAFAE